MEVQVTDVRHELSGRTVVSCVCRHGAAKASWTGVPPVKTESYWVETEVYAVLKRGDNINSSETDEPGIWLEGDMCHAQGRFHILFADVDDVETQYYVRVGHGMFNLGVIHDPPTEEQPCVLAVPHRDIRLWQYNS